MAEKILVVFASPGDSPAYEPILKELDKKELQYVFRMCSCHRTPDLLQEILKEKYSCIIAGAGLSAALPGIIASQVLTPIIGVPVDGAFQGLDALLSILQMPPGYPVLTMGVGNSSGAVTAASQVHQNYQQVTIAGNKNDARVQKCKELLEQFKVNAIISDSMDEHSLNIQFVELDDTVYGMEYATINVPVQDAATAADAVKLLQQTKQGMWVGLNRAENAALAAIQILNKDGKYSKQLLEFREKARQKVLDHDRILQQQKAST